MTFSAAEATSEFNIFSAKKKLNFLQTQIFRLNFWLIPQSPPKMLNFLLLGHNAATPTFCLQIWCLLMSRREISELSKQNFAIFNSKFCGKNDNQSFIFCRQNVDPTSTNNFLTWNLFDYCRFELEIKCCASRIFKKLNFEHFASENLEWTKIRQNEALCTV